MKILVLAPHAYYIDRGTPIDVDILLRALSNRGHTVEVVCYAEGEDRDYPGVTLHRICTPKWLKVSRPGFSPQKLLADVWLWRMARRRARAFQPDVVHANEEAVFIAMGLKRKFGIPYVYDMDSSIAQQLVEKMPWLKPLARFFNACERRAARGAVAAAPVCNALADLAKAHGAPYVETLHDISQLSDPDRDPTGFLQEKHGVSGEVLMYVGNLEAYQGVDLLLEAVAVARQSETGFTLVIAGGTDADISAYEHKAAELGIADATCFIGRWPNQHLGELLAEADILTAPRTRGINTPMKIFPYMHTGKALLATDLVTHNQLLTPEIAMLAPANPEGFAEGLLQLLRDADLRRRLGEAGRAHVLHQHTFEAHQARVDRLYAYVADMAGAAAQRSPASSK